MLSRFHITSNFYNLVITVHRTGKNIRKYGLLNMNSTQIFKPLIVRTVTNGCKKT